MAAAALSDLVGRDEELRRLASFLDEAAHGPEAIVLVGEAGIGKTTLWRAAVERARGRGFRVLEARPTEPERELSFAALGDLLADVHDEIGGLPAPQRRALRVALLLTRALRLVLEGCPRPTIELPEEIEITTLAERPELAQGVWETASEAMAEISADGDVPVSPGSFEEFSMRALAGPKYIPRRRLSPPEAMRWSGTDSSPG